MYVTQAIVAILKDKFENYAEAQSWCERDNLLELLERAEQNLQQYYKLFHSIRWNRSRKQVKLYLESQLLSLAEDTQEIIVAIGAIFNVHARQQIQNIYQFNQLIQLLQEAKMLVEIHHLGNRITAVIYESSSRRIQNCIPGLEHY